MTNKTNPSFNFKQVIISLIVVLVFYFLFFNDTKTNSSSMIVDDEYYVNAEALTTHSKKDFDDMYEYVVHNDKQALQEMLEFGKIVILKKGTPVYLIDASFGYDVIREKGSTEKLWIATERISKK